MLLEEETQIPAKQDETPTQDTAEGDLMSQRLEEIYKRLDAIDAYTAEARAVSIHPCSIKFHPREFNREEIVINIEFPTADYQFQVCHHLDASSVYPGGPLSFRNLNFRIDLGSRIASTKAPPPP
ncbi:unnamed protein product [Brassica oleracea]